MGEERERERERERELTLCKGKNIYVVVEFLCKEIVEKNSWITEDEEKLRKQSSLSFSLPN